MLVKQNKPCTFFFIISVKSPYIVIISRTWNFPESCLLIKQAVSFSIYAYFSHISFPFLTICTIPNGTLLIDLKVATPQRSDNKRLLFAFFKGYTINAPSFFSSECHACASISRAFKSPFVQPVCCKWFTFFAVANKLCLTQVIDVCVHVIWLIKTLLVNWKKTMLCCNDEFCCKPINSIGNRIFGWKANGFHHTKVYTK